MALPGTWAFDDKQLNQSTPGPRPFNVSLPQDRLFVFKASQTATFLWLSFLRKAKRPHVYAAEKNMRLQEQEKKELRAHASAGMMVAPTLTREARFLAPHIFSRRS